MVNKRCYYPNIICQERVNAERFCYDVIVELQTNNRLRLDYGELFKSDRPQSELKQSKRLADFVLTNGIRCEAHTTGESIRGRLHDGHRPDMILMDDIENLKVARSEAAIREVADFMSEMRGGMDQKEGRVLILGNYVSDEANVAALKRDAKGNEMMRYREVWRVDEKTGKPSWPERDVLTDEELKLPENDGKVSIETKRREMWKEDGGNADYEREYQGKPVDPMGDGPDLQGYMALFPKDQQRIAAKPFLRQGPYAIGVDPGGDGENQTVIAVRSAFQLFVYLTEKKSSGKSVAKAVIEAMREFGVGAQSVVVDAFGVGFKCVQELALLGHHVRAVNVGEKLVCETDGYLNDRAYGYFQFRDWMNQGGELCEHPAWREQLRCIRHRTDEKNRRQIIPKKEIIKRGYASPDVADAASYTFLTDLSGKSGEVIYGDSGVDEHDVC